MNMKMVDLIKHYRKRLENNPNDYACFLHYRYQVFVRALNFRKLKETQVNVRMENYINKMVVRGMQICIKYG